MAANDDSGPILSPEIQAATVDSSKTYALQVDGFNGQEATGSIRIQDCTDDIDGDGVLNSDDKCPHSEIAEDFNINGCIPKNVNPDVPGNLFENGCTPSQELARLCFQNFKNPAGKTVPGQIRKCANNVMKEWMLNGIIEKNDRGQIERCLKNVCTTTCAVD